jgi:hypothetical protein
VDPHRGEFFVFNQNPWRKLTAFKVGEAQSGRCLVVVGGQADGFFSLNYVEPLTVQLVQKGWAVVQAMFSSWYSAYGAATVSNDIEDLDMLLHHLVTKMGFSEIVLLCYQTGVQDLLFYLQDGQLRDKISRVIFQGGMRDPAKIIEDDPHLQKSHRERVEQMVKDGKGSQLVPTHMHPRPISAHRYMALGFKHGVQEVFDARQTEDEMAQVIGHISVPALILFCCEDSYRPNHETRSELFDKIQTSVSADVTTKWIPGACDEQLNFLSGFEETLTRYVVEFLDEEDQKLREKDEESRRAKEADAKRGRSVVFQKAGLKRSISQSSISGKE